MTNPESSVCAECGGKGKISYRTPKGDSYKLGDTVVTDLGGISTRPCKCVKDLAPVAGKATWWTSDVIYTETVVIPIGSEALEITAECEVPRGENGAALLRTAANAYYPPLIDLTTERDKLTLHSDTAREIAAALVAAADACDKADELACATAQDHGYQGNPDGEF